MRQVWLAEDDDKISAGSKAMTPDLMKNNVMVMASFRSLYSSGNKDGDDNDDGAHKICLSDISLYAHKDDDSGYRGDIHVHELGTLCFVVECDGFSQ